MLTETGWLPESCDGTPSSLWEQPGWARQAWMHDASSHLALYETPEGDTGWCQLLENTSSMLRFGGDMFIYRFVRWICAKHCIYWFVCLLCWKKKKCASKNEEFCHSRLSRFCLIISLMRIYFCESDFLIHECVKSKTNKQMHCKVTTDVSWTVKILSLYSLIVIALPQMWMCELAPLCDCVYTIRWELATELCSQWCKKTKEGVTK